MKLKIENIKQIARIYKSQKCCNDFITTRLLTIFFVLIFASCNNYEKETAVIKELMHEKEINIQSEKKCVLLIVPVTGCSTCISPVKEFISGIDNSKFLIIGSCYSVRDFKMSFTEDELQNKKYIIDSEGKAFKYGLVDVGPKLYFFENNKVCDVKIVSCTEPDLRANTLNFLK